MAFFRIRRFVVAVCFLALAVTAAHAQSPAGRLLGTKTGGGLAHIYTVGADGTKPQILGNPAFNETSPIWSPDGLQIAYVRLLSSPNRQIWVMNSDSTNQHAVTDPTGFLGLFGWSPDGSKLLYTVGPGLGGTRIWTMNADGSNKVQLTESGFEDHQPAWSPKGDLIAFARCSGPSPETFYCDLHTIHPDGTGDQDITPLNPFDDDGVRWSRDGTRLVYASMNPNEQYNAAVINPDGSAVGQLTNVAGFDSYFPRDFSPDGNLVSILLRNFAPPSTITSVNASAEIYVAKSDGTGLQRLTNNGVLDSPGPWAPDGSRVAFTSRRDQVTGEIYTMKPDGTDVFRVTNDTLTDTVSDWRYLDDTPIGANVVTRPSTDVTVQFSSISGGGITAARVLLPAELAVSPPPNFAPPGGFAFYDISSSATYSGSIAVSLVVHDISTETTCDQLALMHFSSGVWSQAGNHPPVFSSANNACTLTQDVSSLSPFAVTLADTDLDFVINTLDNCPLNFNPDQTDFDLDGIGDACDIPSGPPNKADECKATGWKAWTPRFKNQGDCIQYVNTGK